MKKEKIYCYNLALIRPDGAIESDHIMSLEKLEQMTIDDIAETHDCDVQAVLFAEMHKYDDDDIIILTSDKERKKND